MGYIYVFIGGGIGAMARYAISGWLGQGSENGIPWHTLLSNFLACLFAGIFIAWLPKTDFYTDGRLWLLTGFCGGFSTFSTFGLELMFMMQRGQYNQAALYIVMSLAAAMAGVIMGWKLLSF